MYRPSQYLPWTVVFLFPAHFPLIPSIPLAILIIRMWIVITFVSESVWPIWHVLEGAGGKCRLDGLVPDMQYVFGRNALVGKLSVHHCTRRTHNWA
jgi:hypothetical protein